MYIGEVFIRGIINDNIYIGVRSKNGVEDITICKGESIIALCDPEFNTNDSIPTITRFSYNEVLDCIDKTDEKDLWFDSDLKYICGISIV